MTAYDFSLVRNTSFAIDLTQDTLNMGAIDASTMGVSTDTSGNLVLTVGSDSVTLQGASAAQVTTSNVTFGNATTASAWVVGDNDTGSTFDSTGNTIDTTAAFTGFAVTQANSNHLIYGLGGGDTITVGNGNNVIFGGTGISDSVDGNDTIVIGSGGNTIYTNAGNDSITATTASQAGTTNTIFLGLNDDTLNAAAAHAGNFVARGNTGNDTLTFTGATGDITVFGGNDTVDSTDGNDTITLGIGSATVYGNAGNDTVTSGAITANESVSVFGGAGNDSITLTSATTVNLASTANIFGGNADTDTINMAGFFGDATIYGGLGIASPDDLADTITLGEGSSSVWSNAGDDVINLTGGINNNEAVVINTGAGNDTVNVTTALANAGGTAGDDADISIFSNAGDDVFNLNNNGAAAIEYDFSIGDFAAGDIVNITLDGGAGAQQLTVSGGGSSLTLTDDNGASYVFQGYAGDLDQTNFVISDGSRLVTNFSGTAATLTGAAGEADQLISGTSGDVLIGGETGAGVQDNLVGNGGDDTFQVDDAIVSALNANDYTISGGDGTDTLDITGTTAVALDAVDFTTTNNRSSLEVFKFADVTGHSVTLADANQATLGLTTLDFSALTGTKAVTLIDDNSDFASALTIIGGANTGSMTIVRDTTADQNDNFTLGAGSDSLTTLSTVFTANDTIDGGAGTDTVTFSDGALAALTDAVWANKSNLEGVVLTDSGAAVPKTITIASNAEAAGVNNINGAGLAVGDTLTVDASGYASNGVTISGGADADTLTGGAGADSISGGTGQDSITGGGGADTIGISTGAFTAGNAAADTIVGFVSGTDIFDMTANLLNGTFASSSVLTGANANISTVASDGSATANDVVFALSGAGDQLAAGTTVANAVANAVTALTSGADFAAANVAANDSLLLIMDDGTNSFLFHYFADGTPATSAAADLELLAVVNGVADAGSFANADFI